MKLIQALRKARIVLHFLFTQPKLVRKLHAFLYKGYLLEVGWINSAITKRPVTRDGNPLPWLTYPLIDFLNERLEPSMSVFEYGGGNSTLYFANRVSRVTTVEHNREWVDHLRSKIPNNCELHFRELQYGGDYARTAADMGDKFDIILVDGRDRVNCALHAIGALSEKGVIIFDNFDRERYQEARTFLTKNGFKQFNFWGISPGLMELSNSALFYRAGNVFRL